MQENLFTRDDTMFGVCEAIGEDFGFNPMWLRLTLGVLLLWNPVAVAAFYGAAALLVLASRLIFPNPRRAAAADTDEAAPADAVAPAEAEPLPIAA